jgi:hypothetical protein
MRGTASRGRLRRLPEGEPLVDFGDRELDLLLAHGMRGGFRLPLEVRLRQPERLLFPNLLRIDLRPGIGPPPPLRFPLLDLFLNPRFRVDEAFSGITHKKC